MVTRTLPAAAIALALALAGCHQFTKVDGAPVAAFPRPVVLMHRGGGQANPDFRENTLRAILYGASIYDGAEMDLQLGRDGTIWLGHDNEVHDCGDPAGGATGGAVVGCFQDMGDAEIAAVAYCDAARAAPCADRNAPTCVQHYVTLEEVFIRFTADPTLVPKVLGLDVKDQLCRSTGIFESQDMADSLHRLVTTYHMDGRLFVESDQPTFMRRYRSNGTPAMLFVEGYGGIDPIITDAAREGADGISYRYGKEPLDPTLAPGLRNVGLRVYLWPVPEPQDAVGDIARVWAMSPDVIKTDLPNFFDHVTPLQGAGVP